MKVFFRNLRVSTFIVPALVFSGLPSLLMAQANMRRDAALSLFLGSNGSNDTHGFYTGCMDATNGFAYFGATYVYKIDVRGPTPVQVGNGLSLGRQAVSSAMDPSSGCAYFAAGPNIYQVLANGTGAPTFGAVMTPAFTSSNFMGQLLLDDSDPANHYLYVIAQSGLTNSALYKIALNQFPNNSAIIGSASVLPNEPAMYYGVLDPTNHCAYFGTFVAIGSKDVPYITKFALGAGANPPVRIGGLALDSTLRSVGGLALDVANGYGYCCSDAGDINFGGARLYKWALNGTNAPTFTAYTDFHTNEGYCHVAFIRPDRGLLYFGSDLSYPGKVHRFRLPPGTNAPVETGTLFCEQGTNVSFPAWGTNPAYNTNWGEVFLHSIAYDWVRDYVYFGRDDADGQAGYYNNEIIKMALDRDEAVVLLTDAAANTNTSMPYSESFESYTNGFSLAGTGGWMAEDAQMAVISTNADPYTNVFPIPGAHQFALQVDGAITNRFRPAAASNVWVDLMLQGRYWTDPLAMSPGDTPFALMITTNGHLAVWNCTNPPAPGNGWTELTDTSIASNQFFRLTVEANYVRDANGMFYYRAWVNGHPSTSPQTWYAAADTNQDYFGAVTAEGHFLLDDLVAGVPAIGVTNVVRSGDGSVSLSCVGMPGMSHRVLATTNLALPAGWQFVSTNTAGTDGVWQVNDAGNYPQRFYRVSLP